jgi:deoxyribonuclease V
LLALPTIACSKRPLWREYRELSSKKGAHVFIERENKGPIGAVLRTKDSVKPIFVTPGHKVSIQTAVKIILQCSLRYRIPEPLRQAHILAKREMIAG